MHKPGGTQCVASSMTQPVDSGRTKNKRLPCTMQDRRRSYRAALRYCSLKPVSFTSFAMR
jgi:hypothetical protein